MYNYAYKCGVRFSDDDEWAVTGLVFSQESLYNNNNNNRVFIPSYFLNSSSKFSLTLKCELVL